jgi:tetratricopeptide (TPR) repeat protein
MMGRHPQSARARTLADDLRDDLGRCETWVAQIGAGADGLELLLLLDRVSDEMERLEQRGVDLRAERGRLEAVLGQLARREKALVAQVGAALAEHRPSGARWWWYLDERLAAARRRALKRAVAGTLLGLGLLLGLYWLYERFLAPPPHVRRANDLVFAGEQLIIEGDLEQAIQQFEAATDANPEHVEARVWLGVLYRATDDEQRADASFEQARLLLDDEIRFLFQRGLLYLLLGDADAANEDALAIIAQTPDQPEGYFLLGNIAEHLGDMELAVASFQQADQCAEKVGNVELQATIRMRLATALQLLMTNPEP